MFSVIVSIALRMLSQGLAKKEEVIDLRRQLEETKAERDGKVHKLEGEIRELRGKLDEAGESASKSQTMNAAFTNMLRQRFLKSFEEKIKEIEAARVQELESLKQTHEAQVRQLNGVIGAAS